MEDPPYYLDEIDPNIPVEVRLKHNLRCSAYKGELYPLFWPRTYWKIGDTKDKITWADWFKQWETFEFLPDDIILSSYPKAGHHWMFEALHMIVSGEIKSQNCSKSRNFIDEREMEELKSLPSPRILLTHLKYKDIPKSLFQTGCKVLYLYRNPKDSAVSYMHHIKNLENAYKFKGTWDDYFEILMANKFEYGSWLENVPQWWEKEKDNENVLFMRYEQLKKNFKENSKRIAEFLGKQYKDDFYNELAVACDFSTMQNNPKLDMANFKSKDVKHVFFRKGQVGDWKNYFT
ncbi:unnamed protein product, partial [Owenia fusiformis]